MIKMTNEMAKVIKPSTKSRNLDYNMEMRLSK